MSIDCTFLYLTAYDVQNRLAALLGYKVNKNFKIEAGYLSQNLQQGKRVNDKSVFQYNSGFMLSTHLSFDAGK
ncbi:hypothetical protein ACNQGH_20100 [Flavobacterium sp. ZS1P14]